MLRRNYGFIMSGENIFRTGTQSRFVELTRRKIYSLNSVKRIICKIWRFTIIIFSLQRLKLIWELSERIMATAKRQSVLHHATHSIFCSVTQEIDSTKTSLWLYMERWIPSPSSVSSNITNYGWFIVRQRRSKLR